MMSFGSQQLIKLKKKKTDILLIGKFCHKISSFPHTKYIQRKKTKFIWISLDFLFNNFCEFFFFRIKFNILKKQIKFKFIINLKFDKLKLILFFNFKPHIQL